MNSVVLMGRLVKDPDIRVNKDTRIARYTLAVQRRKQGEADFITCVAFNKGAEFVEKWLHKGTKICVSGRLQTGSYTSKEGAKIYTTEVIVESQEFAESKKGDFQPVPEEEELPFV